MIPALVWVLLGFTPDRAPQPYTELLLTADTPTSSNTTPVIATGSTFTPGPNQLCWVEVYGQWSTSSTTIGLQWKIGDGAADNDATGVAWYESRGTSSTTAPQVYNGQALPGTSIYVATSNGPASSIITSFWGWASFRSDATPSPVSLWFRSETDGNEVILRDDTIIRYWCR